MTDTSVLAATWRSRSTRTSCAPSRTPVPSSSRRPASSSSTCRARSRRSTSRVHRCATTGTASSSEAAGRAQYRPALGSEGAVTVTGMANLAVKVADLDAACAFYRDAGAEIRDRMEWGGGERADVFLGPVMITLFTRAIYEDDVALPPEGFLHPALFTDDLDAELAGHSVVWGPEVVEGAFGRRRIAFVEAPGGIRLEFMEQLAAPEEAAS